EDTHQYQLNGTTAISEWNVLIPPGNGVIHLGSAGQHFTVAMFHQLQCLDVIHAKLVGLPDLDPLHDDSPSLWELTQHYMNYFRRMVLCHLHTALESVQSNVPLAIVDLTWSQYTCCD
ncbi:hypothetical protein SERLA73DRAFT_58173, partial [Serpula lacrymans var. lacrymans S7.3]